MLLTVSVSTSRWRHLTWMETSMHADYPFKDELAPGYVLEKAPKITSSGN